MLVKRGSHGRAQKGGELILVFVAGHHQSAGFWPARCRMEIDLVCPGWQGRNEPQQPLLGHVPAPGNAKCGIVRGQTGAPRLPP